MRVSSPIDQRSRKKLVVFLSGFNPLYAEIQTLESMVGTPLHVARGDAPKVKRRGALSDRSHSSKDVLLKVSHETLRKWSRGEIATTARVSEALSHLCDGVFKLASRLKYVELADGRVRSYSETDAETQYANAISLIERVKVFKRDFEEKAQSGRVYETGRALGMSIDQTQRAVDSAVYEYSVLTRPLYADSNIAGEALRSIEGAYVLWLRRLNSVRHDKGFRSETFFLKCALHVRYIVTQGERSFIRAKLNLPVVSPSEQEFEKARLKGRTWPYWEYDGVVDIRAKRVFWFFEKRDNLREDYISLITGPRDEVVLGGLAGKYLTTAQDSIQTVVSDNLVAEINDSSEVLMSPVESITSFMWNTCAVLNSAGDFMIASDGRQTELKTEYKRIYGLFVGVMPESSPDPYSVI